MNSKANGRMLASGLVDDVFIQPAATDDGTAVGAALAAHHALTARVPRYELKDAYLGAASYRDDEIESTLRDVQDARFVRAEHRGDAAARAAGRGPIVGWFQGRMEFGPRALGNRSILADPRDAEMKDRVNEVVKFREGWRPFAPSVPRRGARRVLRAATRRRPYMILTLHGAAGEAAT